MTNSETTSASKACIDCGYEPDEEGKCDCNCTDCGKTSCTCADYCHDCDEEMDNCTCTDEDEGGE